MRSNLALAILLLVLLAGTTFTETFVSFNGGFYIEYPETWQQIDYRTADHYLSQNLGEGEEPDYEAVFVDRASPAIFAGQYLILTVDTVGSLDAGQIDSVLDVISGEFGREIASVSPDSFLVQWDAERIFYDSVNQATAVITELKADETGGRINLMGMKFFENGIANFFFYSPGDQFEAGLSIYKNMMMSLSTESLDEVLHSDEVKNIILIRW